MTSLRNIEPKFVVKLQPERVIAVQAGGGGVFEFLKS